MKEVRMAMTYDAFLDQMKKDLEAGFAEDLPAKYSQVKIGIRDVEKLQGESYRGISFRVGDAPIEGNLNMQQAYQAHEAGVPYESILRDTQEAIMQQVDRMPQFNIGEISDYASMKANLMMELIRMRIMRTRTCPIMICRKRKRKLKPPKGITAIISMRMRLNKKGAERYG
jgi:hypothetical protein